MPRPSRNIDRELIRAGRELLQENAITDLSLRQVAEHAKANLGMFHYHFKTKDEFVRAVLKDLYEEFFGSVEAEFKKSASEKDPLTRLRGLLEALARFAVEQRTLMASVFRDVLAGNPVVMEFIALNFPRHLGMLHQVMKECQTKKLIRSDLSIPQMIVLCATCLNVPVVIGTSLSRVTEGALEGSLKKEFLSPDSIRKRIDFVLRGLQP
jgi:AcrR family transcriptional regulator